MNTSVNRSNQFIRLIVRIWLFLFLFPMLFLSSCATVQVEHGNQNEHNPPQDDGIGSSELDRDESMDLQLNPIILTGHLEILENIDSLVQVSYEPWNHNLFDAGPAIDKHSSLLMNTQGLARLLVLRRLFPEKIQWVFAGTEDWLISLQGTRFRWADGRMLYGHQDFGDAEMERYMPIWDLRGLQLPIWQRKITSEQEIELLELNDRYGFDPRIRNQGFMDLLYDAPDQQSSQGLMERTRFLNLSLEVHPIVLPALDRVEQRILRLAGEYPDVQNYIDSLSQAWGFFWRPIAGTNRRSMHSYGIAIDLLPQYYGNRFPYWRWALESGYPRWWLLPPRQFYYPHPLVVEAFEKEGFIWGGRWTGFDTIHFEYRPEFMAFEEPLVPLLPKDGGR